MNVDRLVIWTLLALLGLAIGGAVGLEAQQAHRCADVGVDVCAMEIRP